jgi:hypothetical protein
VQTEVDIALINGQAVSEAGGQSSSASAAIRKLHHLQGVMKPLQVGGPSSPAGGEATVAQADAGLIRISFTPLEGGGSRAHPNGGIFNDPGLSPTQWIKLIARLGEIPDPTVSSKPTSSAIPDPAGAAATPQTTNGD